MTYYLIQNDAGRVCRKEKGGCGKVHEYWTRGCRPVAFQHPERYSLFRTKVESERGITLKADEITYSVESSLGTIVKITDEEAKSLNVVGDPAPEEVEKLEFTASYPGSPVVRGSGIVVPKGRNVSTKLGDERWR